MDIKLERYENRYFVHGFGEGGNRRIVEGARRKGDPFAFVFLILDGTGFLLAECFDQNTAEELARSDSERDKIENLAIRASDIYEAVVEAAKSMKPFRFVPIPKDDYGRYVYPERKSGAK